MASCIFKIPLRLGKAASVAQLVEHRFRKPEVKGSSPFAGSIEIKQLQAPSRCLFWFVDISVDRLGAGVGGDFRDEIFICAQGNFGADFSMVRLGTSGGLAARNRE